MRTAFINQLIECARNNERIVLLVGDLGYSVVEPFIKEFPDRFFNVGIAEQNMAGIAAGLAMNGFVVYCYSIGNFPVLRCIEQIRNDISYYSSNVRIVSVGAGFAYGSQGVSHFATEDIGMMRTLPNMTVCTPSDPYETKMLTELSSHYQGPMYIRLGKAGEKNIHHTEITDYKIGDLLPIRVDGHKDAIISGGSILYPVLCNLSDSGLDYDVYSIPVVKPINTEQLCRLATSHERIIVIEEHQKSCGIGSAIIECLSDCYDKGMISKECLPRIQRNAINDEHINVAGNQSFLREIAGLMKI